MIRLYRPVSTKWTPALWNTFLVALSLSRSRSLSLLVSFILSFSLKQSLDLSLSLPLPVSLSLPGRLKGSFIFSMTKNWKPVYLYEREADPFINPFFRRQISGELNLYRRWSTFHTREKTGLDQHKFLCLSSLVYADLCWFEADVTGGFAKYSVRHGLSGEAGWQSVLPGVLGSKLNRFCWNLDFVSSRRDMFEQMPGRQPYRDKWTRQ